MTDIPHEFQSSATPTMRDLEVLRRDIREKIDSIRIEDKIQFESIKEAIKKADIEMNRRLEGMNEFRQQLYGQAATFLTKERFEIMHQEFGKRIELLENKYSNLQGKILATGAVVAIILTVIETILHFIPVGGPGK